MGFLHKNGSGLVPARHILGALTVWVPGREAIGDKELEPDHPGEGLGRRHRPGDHLRACHWSTVCEGGPGAGLSTHRSEQGRQKTYIQNIPAEMQQQNSERRGTPEVMSPQADVGAKADLAGPVRTLLFSCFFLGCFSCK